MHNRRDIIVEVGFFLILSAFVLAFFFNDEAISFVSNYIGENYIFSVFLFILTIFSATVIAPLTTIPFVAPIGVVLFGPFLTAVFAIIGWTLGAVVAFQISRHVGRNILSRFVSLDKLDKYQKYIPENTEFVSLVCLRLFLPVDILSYAVGLFSRISLVKYTIATIIGITPFSFIISYGVSAVLMKDTKVMFYSVVAGVILLVSVFIYYSRNIAKKEEIVDK